MVVFVEVPSFLSISKATPKVKEAPLPPAMRIILSADLVRSGVAPYGPSIDARNDTPGFFFAYW